jgi:hypothetical protein
MVKVSFVGAGAVRTDPATVLLLVWVEGFGDGWVSMGPVKVFPLACIESGPRSPSVRLSLAGTSDGSCGWRLCEFFLNIALFISISEISIDLQEFSKVGQHRSRRMRQQQVASGGCD